MKIEDQFSGFYANFLRHNNLAVDNFREFIFYRGMLFSDTGKWWESEGNRPSPHEGIDLVYYADISGAVNRIKAGTKIPSIGPGRIAAITGDILGKSIFLEHDLMNGDMRLYSSYAHVKPGAQIKLGQDIQPGEIIASINELSEKKYKIFPHLHLTLAWIPPRLFPDNISWEIMGNRDIVSLIDPLKVLNLPFRVIEKKS